MGKPDSTKATKYKTTTKEKTLNPEYHEEFTYDIDREKLRSKTLELTVWDYEYGTVDNYIGGLQFNLQSEGSTHNHWHEAIEKYPNHRIKEWHTLSAVKI